MAQQPEMLELPNGMLPPRMRLNNIEDVERWVLSLGNHVTVVRPQVLADRLGETGRWLVERYTIRKKRLNSLKSKATRAFF
jgi:hypothetical protein